MDNSQAAGCFPASAAKHLCWYGYLPYERKDERGSINLMSAHRALVVYHRQRPLGSLILLPLRDVGIERQIRPARMEALNQIINRDFPRWRRLDKPREGHCGHVHDCLRGSLIMCSSIRVNSSPFLACTSTLRSICVVSFFMLCSREGCRYQSGMPFASLWLCQL